MNKKIFAIAMIMLFVASVFAFAVEAVYSGEGTKTLTVRSASKQPISGSVCVTFDKGNGEKGSIDINFELPYNGATKTFSIPGTILYISSNYCYVVNE